MRPYRSHRIPACDRCRRQKRRCVSEEAGRPCLLCTAGGKECLFSGEGRDSGRANLRRGLRKDVGTAVEVEGMGTLQQENRGIEAQNESEESGQTHRIIRHEGGGGSAEGEIGVANHLSRALDTAELTDRSSMIVSPVITEDIQALDNYMTPKSSSAAARNSERVDACEVDDSVLYLSVPRRREGLAIAENPGAKQWNILSHLLMPYTEELARLYFDRIQPSFPFLDEESFLKRSARDNTNEKPSAALLCEFYALSLTQWANSPRLRSSPKPEPEFVWNLAVEALHEDYLAPAMSTLYAAVLEMLGRPVFSVVGNAINNGRTVVLANSLGLHRSPRRWRRPREERDRRVRLWWAVLIQDRWSSFAHGIPPSITNNHYDVPLPDLESLITQSRRTEERIKGAEGFIQLCRLTEILGELLPLVYDVKSKQDRTIWREIRRLETSLDSWESDLPSYLSFSNKAEGLGVVGLSSLRLCYLAVRLLVARISLHAAGMADPIDRQDSQRYHLSKLRLSAQDMVVFICSLDQGNLQEFWLPYTAHFLTFTVIILLRCTIESVDPAAIQSCKSSLTQLWEKLQQAAAQDNWDLANICIQRCQEPYDRVTRSFSGDSSPSVLQPSSGVDGDDIRQHINPGQSSADGVPDLLPFANPDLSFESGDDLWDALWFGIDGTGNLAFDEAALETFPP